MGPAPLPMGELLAACKRASGSEHPFTKQPTIFKAKPARKVVKVRALAALKKTVQ